MKKYDLNESLSNRYCIESMTNDEAEYLNEFPIKNKELFYETYLEDLEFDWEEYLNNVADEESLNAKVIPGYPDVPYLSNGDPGSPGEPDSVDKGSYKPYSEVYSDYFNMWYGNISTDMEVAEHELITEPDKFRKDFNDMFNEYIPYNTYEDDYDETVEKFALDRYYDERDNYYDE